MSRKNACGFEFQAEIIEHNYKSSWHILRVKITAFLNITMETGTGIDEGSIPNLLVTTRSR